MTSKENAQSGPNFIWSIDLLSHLMRQFVNSLLAPLDLTFPKYMALKRLQKQEAMTNADLARACLVRPQTMNSIVRDLSQQGLLDQTAAPDRALKLIYTLTPKATDLLTQADFVMGMLEAQFTHGLGAEKIDEMHNMLADTLQRLQLAIRGAGQ